MAPFIYFMLSPSNLHRPLILSITCFRIQSIFWLYVGSSCRPVTRLRLNQRLLSLVQRALFADASNPRRDACPVKSKHPLSIPIQTRVLSIEVLIVWNTRIQIDMYNAQCTAKGRVYLSISLSSDLCRLIKQTIT